MDMKPLSNDCIAAIATPPGRGAIAIIRISGKAAIELAEMVFRGKTVLHDAAGYSVHFGRMVNLIGNVLDEGLATVFREPHSYTGENLVELSCHGGPVIARSILDAVRAAGARQADPGEFTRRAFVNGKMDLSQAEAVADLIAASGERAQRCSVAQLRGKLGSRVGELRSELLSLCALLEIDLDFSEERLEVISPSVISDRLQATDAKLAQLEESFAVGRIYRDGISVALAGMPNAGKSSLFNALLKEDRAIVTPHPGTTRDTIEEAIDVDGVHVRLTDTAGMRDVPDAIEAEGVRRAKSSVRTADVVLLVVDVSSRLEAGRVIKIEESPKQKVIVALNKVDLIEDQAEREKLIGEFGADSILTSCITGEGVHEVRRVLRQAALDDEGLESEDLFVTSERHLRAIVSARESLANARAAIRSGKSYEFIAFDVREGASALAQITGEITSEEILNTIFGTFCIGK